MLHCVVISLDGLIVRRDSTLCMSSLPARLGPRINPKELAVKRTDIANAKFESSQFSFNIALQTGTKSKKKEK